MDGWSKIKPGATYAGVSERTFRYYLKDGLRHVRLPSGTILTKAEWIDAYYEKFTVEESGQVDKIVNETLRNFR
jgi:hypothetical protein